VRIDTLEKKLEAQELQHKAIVSNLEKELKNVESRAQSLQQQLQYKEDIEKKAIEGLFTKIEVW
jgi:predicted RNase H-like nuclease (RuvC/YqgF family)